MQALSRWVTSGASPAASGSWRAWASARTSACARAARPVPQHRDGEELQRVVDRDEVVHVELVRVARLEIRGREREGEVAGDGLPPRVGDVQGHRAHEG